MKTIVKNIRTSAHTQMIDITAGVMDCVREAGVTDGVVTVFVPHTTAAVTLNENADPDVKRDFTYEINKIVPWEDHYYHVEGNSAAHLKASMIGFSETFIVEDGKPMFGTWQDLYFVEFDGPRRRHYYIKIQED